jgi:hypothetical protein
VIDNKELTSIFTILCGPWRDLKIACNAPEVQAIVADKRHGIRILTIAAFWC